MTPLSAPPPAPEAASPSPWVVAAGDSCLLGGDQVRREPRSPAWGASELPQTWHEATPPTRTIASAPGASPAPGIRGKHPARRPSERAWLGHAPRSLVRAGGRAGGRRSQRGLVLRSAAEAQVQERPRRAARSPIRGLLRGAPPPRARTPRPAGAPARRISGSTTAEQRRRASPARRPARARGGRGRPRPEGVSGARPAGAARCWRGGLEQAASAARAPPAEAALLSGKSRSLCSAPRPAARARGRRSGARRPPGTACAAPSLAEESRALSRLEVLPIWPRGAGRNTKARRRGSAGEAPRFRFQGLRRTCAETGLEPVDRADLPPPPCRSPSVLRSSRSPPPRSGAQGAAWRRRSCAKQPRRSLVSPFPQLRGQVEAYRWFDVVKACIGKSICKPSVCTRRECLKCCRLIFSFRRRSGVSEPAPSCASGAERSQGTMPPQNVSWWVSSPASL